MMDIETAREYLTDYKLEPGETVYTLVTSAARSGMSRRIKAYVMRDNEPMNITHLVAAILGYSLNDAGMLVRGCGMDIGFHVVYSLSREVFAGHGEGDAGYVLNQRWI